MRVKSSHHLIWQIMIDLFQTAIFVRVKSIEKSFTSTIFLRWWKMLFRKCGQGHRVSELSNESWLLLLNEDFTRGHFIKFPLKEMSISNVYIYIYFPQPLCCVLVILTSRGFSFFPKMLANVKSHFWGMFLFYFFCKLLVFLVKNYQPTKKQIS